MSQPTIANSDRTVAYAVTASVGPFPVPFPLFDATGADLAVTLDGVAATGWTYSGSQEDGFYGAPSTWINGSITFAAPVTGALLLDGDRAPRRIGQFQEGRGVPARDLNTEFNIVTAIARELWLRCRRLAQSIVDLGERMDGYIPAILAYIAQAGAHAAASAQSALVSKSWAEQPYGEPVISDPDGRSAKHWQELAHQWATEAAMLAGLAGALIYDFNLPSDLVGDEDWNNPT